MKTFLKSNYDCIENPIPVSKIAEICCKKSNYGLQKFIEDYLEDLALKPPEKMY